MNIYVVPLLQLNQILVQYIKTQKFNKMWKTYKDDQSKSALNWKYGEIIITKSEPLGHINSQNISNSFLITTNPFKDDGNIPTLIIQSSETNKCMAKVQQIIQWFIDNKVNRNSHIFIKGGGMLLDMASFAASIYMRGIKVQNVYMIPTTLLAMVDATIGGKNGINYFNTKNLIGTIRNPKTIYIHLPYLRSQTKRQFFNGMVETIKMAATYDSQFFSFLQSVNFQTLQDVQNEQNLLKIVKRSLQMKINVVQTDLTQQNQRKWLNFGHTLGHTIQLSEGNTLLHGECVAIGIVKACQIAISKNIMSQASNSNTLPRLLQIFKKMNLTTEIPVQINKSKMIQIMLRDKKKSSSSIQEIDFVLIQQIGKRCHSPTKVSLDEVEQLLNEQVQVKYPLSGAINNIGQKYKFPSSKSISLRIIYIQCLKYLKNQKKNATQISNFLDCEDTQKMVGSLSEMGFAFDWNKQQKSIKIKNYVQKYQGTLNVGNSGITTRFILPLCFILKGQWTITCHQRMSQRPNQQIINLCKNNFIGQIKFQKRQNCFPLVVHSEGNTSGLKQILVNGEQSSQFVSSIMINSAFINTTSRIMLKHSIIVSESYIKMTCQCLQQYGIKSFLNKEKSQITIQSNGLNQNMSRIQIQKDLSTFSYPYIFNEFHHFPNQYIFQNYMQGDTLFYQYVKYVKQNLDKTKIQLDFNNCTDTFMTFAVYVCSQTIQNSFIQEIKIFNISNQRVKESNRIDLTIKNMKKVGIFIQEHQNSIIIYTKMMKLFIQKVTVFQTDGDHRLAMSFAVLSTYLSKIQPNKNFIIDCKKAVQKTFPQFWNYLKQTGIILKYNFNSNLIKKQNIQKNEQHQQNITNKFSNVENITREAIQKSIILIGNRGSGKSTIAKKIADRNNYIFLDTDEVLTQKIKEQYKLNSISEMVQKNGWNQFRYLQSQVLQDVLINTRRTATKPLVISTGGGILDKNINKSTLQRENKNIVYIERQFKDLKLEESDHRPVIDNFQQISKTRQKVYQKVASLIIDLSDPSHPDIQIQHVMNSLTKYRNTSPQLKQGFIACLNQIPDMLTQEQKQVETFQFRIDKLLQTQHSLKQIRRKISNFQMKYNKTSILTLRTKSQLGQFQGDYWKMMKQLGKIPTNFIDIQIEKCQSINRIHLNLNKGLFSYHGDKPTIVQRLIDFPYGFKKFCYINKSIPSINLYQKHKNSLKNGICIDLQNPLSRLQTKYQMIALKPQQINKTGIMSLKQMKLLKQIF